MQSSKVIEVYRDDIVESSHLGHAAIVNAEGKLLYYVGDWQRNTYARSSLKPVQTIPIIETGAAKYYDVTYKELSLFCSSHNSEPRHVATVNNLLKKVGLCERDLQCGTHIPFSSEVYYNLIKNNKEVTTLHNNCSGKHLGMLLSAKYLGESLDNYYDINHPVQQRILATISQVADYPLNKIDIGIDGCGTPVFALPLNKIAQTFAKLASPNVFSKQRKDAVINITQAMTKHSEMVAGKDRFCTDFMSIGNERFIGKLGAESVYCIGDRETGIGIAVKIEDGDYGRALYPFVMEILLQLGLISLSQLQKLKKYHKPVIKNTQGEVIGQILPSFKLQKC